MSENIRRDHRKATAAKTEVVRRHGWAAMRDLAYLVRLRREVMRRNGMAFQVHRDYCRHALKLACLGERAFIATARTSSGCQAAFFGVVFGENVYYLGGGTACHSEGSGSNLFLTLLEEWFHAHPAGNLYLVVRDEHGQVETVRYHFLNTLLLAEVQRLERERADQQRQLTQQARDLEDLRAMVEALLQRR